MFTREWGYAVTRRKSIEDSRALLNLAAQKHWPVNRSGARRVWLPVHTLFAQNNSYLELCNPGWKYQWYAGMALLYAYLPYLFIVWGWYCFAVHPLFSGKLIFILPHLVYDSKTSYLLLGWLLLFPMALASAFMIFAMLYYMGQRTNFFTYLRGRIRFNRLTRKVYILRPSYCGGNQVYDWDRIVALQDTESVGKWKQAITPLALYHPPYDLDDPEGKGEDCIFVGNADGEQEASYLWEYIRQYMEVGPSVDRIPKDAPETYKGIARYLSPNYFTYCGKPSWAQYRMEQRPGIMETTFHMISQVTCSWAKFPKEWQSDSGLGEPEDRPVQTGAVMTALVYLAEGKLSKEDEIELLTHWGTEEALAEAKAR